MTSPANNIGGEVAATMATMPPLPAAGGQTTSQLSHPWPMTSPNISGLSGASICLANAGTVPPTPQQVLQQLQTLQAQHQQQMQQMQQAHQQQYATLLTNLNHNLQYQAQAQAQPQLMPNPIGQVDFGVNANTNVGANTNTGALSISTAQAAGGGSASQPAQISPTSSDEGDAAGGSEVLVERSSEE